MDFKCWWITPMFHILWSESYNIVNICDNSWLPCDAYHPSLVIILPVNNADVPFMEFDEYVYNNFKLANYIDLINILPALIGL